MMMTHSVRCDNANRQVLVESKILVGGKRRKCLWFVRFRNVLKVLNKTVAWSVGSCVILVCFRGPTSTCYGRNQQNISPVVYLSRHHISPTNICSNEAQRGRRQSAKKEPISAPRSVVFSSRE